MKEVILIGGSGAIGMGILPVFPPSRYNVSLVSHNSFMGWESPVEVVINLAGATVNCELYRSAPDLHKEVIDSNCLLPVNILAKFLPKMKECGYGRIIMMSSIFSEINIIGQGVYSASKAFVDKLVKIAAIENARHGITVNSIQLGYTGVGMGEMNPETNTKAISKIGMKRFCTMQEIYQTIDYIINTEYLTGQNIRLDGGIR